MRVLLAHHLFAPDFAGGGEVVALHTALELRRRGVDVRVLTTGDPAVAAPAGIPITRLPIHPYRLNLAVATIARHARDADAIHTFTYHAALPSLLAARLRHIPVVCSILGLFDAAWIEMRGPVAGRLWRGWERMLIRRKFDRVIYPSASTRALALRMGADASGAHVIEPGIEIDSYAPAPQKENHVLFVGKLESRKGVDDILAVAAALPGVPFRLVGWGPEEDAYRRAAPPNVTIVRLERGAALRDEFARAAIFLLPSRAETFGIAVVEAMASGCAVITSVPLDFAGTTVRAGDRPAVTEAVRRLWSRPEQALRAGARNVDLARRYSWARHGAKLHDLYMGLDSVGGDLPGTPHVSD